MQPDTTLPKEPKVGIYSAILTQGGTNAPTAVICHNTIGDIVYTYDSAGTYIGTLANKLPYTKTIYLITQTGGNTQVMVYSNSDDSTFTIQTKDSIGADADGVLFDCSFKIEVYN